MTQTGDVTRLLTDIFTLTGQKVQADDPIVVAALISSQLIRQAGHEARDAIQSAVDQILLDLAEAVKNERQAAAHAYIETMNKAKTPTAWKIKITLGASLVILFGGVAGGLLGASWLGNHTLSQVEVQELAAGKEYLRILPLLDQQTREKLVQLTEKNRPR